MSGLPEPETFLSGETGHVAGMRRRPARRVADLVLDVRLLVLQRRLEALAAGAPRLSVVVLGLHRAGSSLIEPAVRELRASRHDVRVVLGSAEELGGGKFQNLNALRDDGDADWTLVVDDDVALPRRFLDRFLGVCERCGFALAQPAQTMSSHAAWPVTRRRGGSLARETRFVEIGPVTAFRREAAAALIPFPDLRFGWGLDLHWAAIAAERGWRLGIVDAVPVRHEAAPVATAYDPREAIDEARHFLAGRPYLPAARAAEVVAVHR